MKYHAHIYFDLQDLLRAERLLLILQGEKSLRVHKLIPRKVGPHARPMIEVHFQIEKLKEVHQFLVTNAVGFSVLIHPDSGDDYADHAAEKILWIGEKLEIDFSFFDKVKAKPELSLH